MKKFLKLIALAAITVAAALACVFAGCNSSGETKSDYNFTIVYEGGEKDGKAVNGNTDGKNGGKVATQICLDAQGGGCVPLSMSNIYPSSGGKLYLSQAKINELFTGIEGVTPGEDVTHFYFHAMNIPGYKSDCVVEVNGKGDYTVKVVLDN